jgi:hypothetical protein
VVVAQHSTSPRDTEPPVDAPDSLPGLFAAVRVLPVAFLVMPLVARCIDDIGRPDYWYLAFVIAAFAMPLWYTSGLVRRPWQTAPWALLAVQAVLTYLPFAVLGDEWVGGEARRPQPGGRDPDRHRSRLVITTALYSGQMVRGPETVPRHLFALRAPASSSTGRHRRRACRWPSST